MVQPFTTDPRAMLETVRGKEFQKAIRTSETTGLSADVANLKQMADDYCGECPCGPTAANVVDGMCTAKKAEIQGFVDGTAERTALLTTNFLKQLQGVIAQLSRAPGGRWLLLISDGFTLEPGRELYGILSAFMPNDPAWRFNPRDVEHELEPILRFASASKCCGLQPGFPRRLWARRYRRPGGCEYARGVSPVGRHGATENR